MSLPERLEHISTWDMTARELLSAAEAESGGCEQLCLVLCLSWSTKLFGFSPSICCCRPQIQRSGEKSIPQLNQLHLPQRQTCLLHNWFSTENWFKLFKPLLMAGLGLSLNSLQGELGAAFLFHRVLLNWMKGTEFKGEPREGVLFKHSPKVPIMRKHVSHSHV